MSSREAGVLIREVGLRDGLQNEKKFIETEDKITLARALTRAGLKEVEVTSFVSPKAVPQMRDALQVVEALGSPPGVSYAALVVNSRGAEDAIAAGVRELQLTTTCSETHSEKNVRMTVEQALSQIEAIARLAGESGVTVRVALSTVFGCPYEGNIPYDRVYSLVERLLGMGMARVALSDTAGLGNPRQVSELCQGILARFPEGDFSLHIHDTRGMGLACVTAGVWAGIRVIESSIGGLGGCPFIPNATGNIATEDVVYMLEAMGLPTGLDWPKLLEAAFLAEKIVGRELGSRQLALARGQACIPQE